MEDVQQYFQRANCDVIVQEYVNLPEEISVFYQRLPGNQGTISSLCFKENLSVTGNGQDTVKKLMQNKDRAVLQIDRLSKLDPLLLQYIPPADETVLLEPIGNHSRGTKFINGNHQIDQRLIDRFNAIFKDIRDVQGPQPW